MRWPPVKLNCTGGAGSDVRSVGWNATTDVDRQIGTTPGTPSGAESGASWKINGIQVQVGESATTEMLGVKPKFGFRNFDKFLFPISKPSIPFLCR